MTSESTYASLCQQAYKSGGGTPPKGWQVLKTKDHNGYQLVAYINSFTQEVVIAVPGTDVNKPETLFNDLQIVLKQTLHFEELVSEFSQEVQADLSHRKDNYQLSFTGHSLGGYLAQLAALKTNHKAVVFESPGVLDTVEKDPQNYHLDSADITIVNTQPNPINSVNRQIVTPKYIQVKPAEGLGQTVSKFAVALASLGLIAYGPQKLKNGWESLSASSRQNIKQVAVALFSALSAFAIKGLTSSDTKVATGLRFAEVINNLKHYHRIDNIVTAYESNQGNPPQVSVDPDTIQRINNVMQDFLSKAGQLKFDYNDLKELSTLFDSNQSISFNQIAESTTRLIAAPAA